MYIDAQWGHTLITSPSFRARVGAKNGGKIKRCIIVNKTGKAFSPIGSANNVKMTIVRLLDDCQTTA